MIRYKTLYDYILIQVELFTLLIVPFNPLRPKEKEIFIWFVIASINGIDINNPDANEFVRDKMDYRFVNDIWQYKSKLFKKGWFKKDKNGNYSFIKNFDYNPENFSAVKTYNYTLKYEPE